MKCDACDKIIIERKSMNQRFCTLTIWPYNEEKFCSVECVIDYIKEYHVVKE